VAWVELGRICRPHGVKGWLHVQSFTEALVGMMIEVARSELPPPGQREYYRADLVGLAVSNRAGVELGVLANFVESAAGALMVIRDAAGAEHWVPASPEHLWAVDLAAGRIVVNWPLGSA
jgi:16S rRNA processing protein RimM